MKWDKDRSIVLSMAGVALFAAALLALDCGCYWVAAWFVRYHLYHFQYGALFMVSVYAGSFFGWVCLVQLWRLLGALKKGDVFTETNVERLRRISWCCVWAAAICLASTLYYRPFLFVFVAAGFMGLIVRVVKNAFQQAVAMKNELDLTV